MSCSCKPKNFPFSCQRTNCPNAATRPQAFETQEQFKTFCESHNRGRPDCVEFACIHRGTPIGLAPCVPCGGIDLRTGKSKFLLVLECLHPDIRRKCTVTAGGIRDEKGKLPVCMACEHRQANRNLIAGQPESA